jgi:hypothetical protein
MNLPSQSLPDRLRRCLPVFGSITGVRKPARTATRSKSLRTSVTIASCPVSKEGNNRLPAAAAGPRTRTRGGCLGVGATAVSSAIWLLDFENDRYLIPFGIGAGKVVPVGTVLNAFLEPQVAVYEHGAGLPIFQVFTGVNLQWAKR